MHLANPWYNSKSIAIDPRVDCYWNKINTFRPYLLERRQRREKYFGPKSSRISLVLDTSLHVQQKVLGLVVVCSDPIAQNKMDAIRVFSFSFNSSSITSLSPSYWSLTSPPNTKWQFGREKQFAAHHHFCRPTLLQGAPLEPWII